MNFVFDVDGTLTPSRDKIDKEFHDYFLAFCKRKPVYLVTGSDYPKTEEQLGSEICNRVEGVYNCLGNVLTKNGAEIYRNDFELTEFELIALNSELIKSGFSVRTGNHIEKRVGLVNFSIVGRNATKAERYQYIEWDTATNEREIICKHLNDLFTRLQCVVGGETGIDIFLRGKDKRQILQYIDKPVIFFGDKCIPGGNDYSIAIESNIYYNVLNWQETYIILKEKYT